MLNYVTDLLKSSHYLHDLLETGIGNGSETKTRIGISFWKVNFRNFFQIYEELI